MSAWAPIAKTLRGMADELFDPILDAPSARGLSQSQRDELRKMLEAHDGGRLDFEGFVEEVEAWL